MSVKVRQKKRGRGQPWWVVIHHNRRRVTKKIGRKEDAEALASAVRRKIKAGEFNVEAKPKGNTTPLFQDYARHYIEHYAKVTCKHNTWRGYEVIIEHHLLPSWKGKHLDEITRADVIRLLRQKQKEGKAASTVDNIRTLASGIFTLAYEEEIIPVNPALRLGKYIRKDDRRKHIKPLTQEQVATFLDAVKESFPEHYPLVLYAFRTGMRFGELLGLAWSDIDFEANAIEVKRSYSHGRFDSPKSHKSRTVDMSDQLNAVLKDQRQSLLQKFGGKLPVWNIPGSRKATSLVELVFPNRDGGPICGDNFRKRSFRKMIEKADLPRFRFHDIRHTFASLLLANCEPLNYVKEQLGHASIQTTVDVYGGLVPGSNRNAVNRLDDADGPALTVVAATSA